MMVDAIASGMSEEVGFTQKRYTSSALTGTKKMEKESEWAQTGTSLTSPACLPTRLEGRRSSIAQGADYCKKEGRTRDTT
jgi:hypothetical protein